MRHCPVFVANADASHSSEENKQTKLMSSSNPQPGFLSTRNVNVGQFNKNDSIYMTIFLIQSFELLSDILWERDFDKTGNTQLMDFVIEQLSAH